MHPINIVKGAHTQGQDVPLKSRDDVAGETKYTQTRTHTHTHT